MKHIEIVVAVAKRGATARANVATTRREQLLGWALRHGATSLVRVGPRDRRRAADHRAIGAAGALATQIKRHEEIVVGVVEHDRWRFDGAATRARSKSVLRGIVGRWLSCYRIELAQFDPRPERPEHEPWTPLLVEADVGIDGVEVVTLLRLHDESLVDEAVVGTRVVERWTGCEPDHGHVRSECRTSVVDMELPVEVANVRRPQASRIRAKRQRHPRRRAHEDPAGVGPLKQVAGASHVE